MSTTFEPQIGEPEIRKLVKLGVPATEAETYSLGQFLEFIKWTAKLESLEEPVEVDGDKLKTRRPYARLHPYDYQYESLGRQRQRAAELPARLEI